MNHLQSLRVKAGLTQKALALAAGCAQPSISAIEKGAVPSIVLARDIAAALNQSGRVVVSLDDIFPPDQHQAA